MTFYSRRPPLHQTLLGPSTRNELMILNVPQRNPISAQRNDNSNSERAFIFKLPDELLTGIFELLASDVPENHYRTCYASGNYAAMKRLARVCHRFHQIIIPCFYRIINLRHPNSVAPPSRRAARLHYTLEKNASFRQHCRSLSIYIPDMRTRPSHGGGFSVANDLATWLTKTRCIDIHGGFSLHGKDMWAFIQNITRHMRELEHIHISRESWNLLLPDIMAHIDLPSLVKLDIHGISESTSKENILKTARGASFTSLSLSDYEESPEATKLLIQWPKALTHFTFGSFYGNRFYMDLSMFHSWLQVHKDTLVYISIGYLSKSTHKRLFNSCDFPNLETLKLSRWSMKELDTPAADADILLAPNLKTFGWDFTIYDQHSESWTAFGDKEENWVRGIAKAAIEKKTGLKKIEIVFTPEGWDTKMEDGYPWDRMDRIHDEIQQNGLTLRYNQPSITKEAWLESFIPWDEVEQNAIESINSEPSGSDLVDTDLHGSDSDPQEFVFPDLHNPQTTFQGRDIREYFRSV
ncbi:F-box domain protein [Xylogone sp. PMI_703]|nr:F-box domain protein [Xylogone sp. PMI_703]